MRIFNLTSLPVLSVCLAVALCAEGVAAEDFFSVRKQVIGLHGARAQDELAEPYETSRRQYLDTSEAVHLYRMAALAELADMEDAHGSHLREIFSESDEAGFALYYIEHHRSRGTIAENTDEILAGIARLSRQERLNCLRSLCRALAWQTPPPALPAAIEAELNDGITTVQALFFSTIFAGWEMQDEAVEILGDAFDGARGNLPAMRDIITALSAVGAGPQARRKAAEIFGDITIPPAPTDMSARDIYMIRQARLTRLGEIAGAAAAWDMLLDRVDPQGDDRDPTQMIDRAVVLDAAGLAVEAVEILARLAAAPGANGETQAFYGSALVQAGDAFSGREILLTAITRQGASGDDAYYDLMDAITALGDAPTLKAFAALFLVAFEGPQQSRLMADIMRTLGEYDVADRLFASFVEETGMGRDTRFAWQGGRLLTTHYLDSGRQEKAAQAAREAFDHLISEERMRGSATSPAADQFVDLFARFGGLEELIDLCRESRAEYPEAILIYRIEQSALESLNRWDEAIALEQRMSQMRDPVEADLFLALAHKRAGRWQEAERLYSAAIAADSDVPAVAWWELARSRAEQEDWAGVEEAIETAPFPYSHEVALQLAGFYRRYGQLERASAVYEALDHLPTDILPEHLASAITFWVANGEVQRAADALARRVAIQTGLEAKKAYFNDAITAEAALARRYLDLGRALETGPLAADRQLLAWFYGELAGILESVLDPEGALEAWKRARRLDPADPAFSRSLARLTAPWQPRLAGEAADAIIREGIDAAVLADAALAAFADGRREAAGRLLEKAVGAPRSISRAARLLEVLEAYPADHDLYLRLARRVGLVPWTVVARAAAAAGDAGHDALAMNLADEVASGGDYIGRALWSAGFLSVRGMTDEALQALKPGASPQMRPGGGSDRHPAGELAKIDILLGEGRRQEAAEAALQAARDFGEVESVKRLFEGEARRIEGQLKGEGAWGSE